MVFDKLPVVAGIVLGCVLGMAVYTDLRFGKIYNWLTIPCMAIGVTLNAAAGGWVGVIHSLAGVVLVMILFLIFAPAAGIGGGDTKLMMAVASVLGLKPAVWAMLCSAMIGGLLALVVLLRYRAVLSTTRGMAGNVFARNILRAPVGITDGGGKIKFRYSPAIALGTLLTFAPRIW